MKNKMPIVIIATIIIIIIIVIILLSLSGEGAEQNVDLSEFETNPLIEEKFELENTPIKEPYKFFTIQDIITEYLNNISLEEVNNLSVIDQAESNLTEEQKNERIYSKLSSVYISKNNITVENVKDYVYKHQGRLVFYPIAMNGKQNSNIINYSVHGRIRDISTGNFTEIYLIVTTDTNNNTFAIEPINEQVDSIEKIDLNTSITSIEENEYNTFSYKQVSAKDLLEKYIGSYRAYTILQPEIAYSYLDEDYKNKRFGTFENYQEYLEEAKKYSIKLDKYQVTKKDSYTQYVCVDENGNYYIINETATMQYKLILDNHTIDLTEFTEKYNSTSEENKVSLNIEKIKDALNTKDYKYIYNKLDETFKQNNFDTQEKFEEYVKQNLYEINHFIYSSAEEKNGIYIIDVKITDKQGTNIDTKNISFVIKLLENNDFVMSFSVN